MEKKFARKCAVRSDFLLSYCKTCYFFSVVVVIVQWLLEPLVQLPSKTLLDMSWDDFVENPTIR